MLLKNYIRILSNRLRDQSMLAKQSWTFFFIQSKNNWVHSGPPCVINDYGSGNITGTGIRSRWTQVTYVRHLLYFLGRDPIRAFFSFNWRYAEISVNQIGYKTIISLYLSDWMKFQSSFNWSWKKFYRIGLVQYHLVEKIKGRMVLQFGRIFRLGRFFDLFDGI